MQADNALIVFLKYPEPGKVKTRLAKVIGSEKACVIYRLMAEGVIKNIFLKNEWSYDVWIFFTPLDKENETKDWLNSIINNQNIKTWYAPQEGSTLGERISNAFKKIFQEKPYKRGLVIGTDCPAIDTALIGNAFDVLKEKDIVIGPCKDGGYYLLGMSGHVPLRFSQQPVFDLFMDIDWGTDRVLKQTIEKVHKNNLSCHILKTLTDVDRIEDLYQCLPGLLQGLK